MHNLHNIRIMHEPQMEKMRLASWLKATRVDHRLNQTKLAELLNKTQATISRYESGKVPIPLAVLDQAKKLFNDQNTAALEQSVPIDAVTLANRVRTELEAANFAATRVVIEQILDIAVAVHPKDST